MEQLIEPREMRIRITQVASGRTRVDGTEKDIFSSAGSIARAVLITSQMQGLSEEEAMTVLAYHALAALESMSDQLLDFMNRSPRPIFIERRED